MGRRSKRKRRGKKHEEQRTPVAGAISRPVEKTAPGDHVVNNAGGNDAGGLQNASHTKAPDELAKAPDLPPTESRATSAWFWKLETGTKVAVITLGMSAVAIVVAIATPEVRRLVGLSESSTHHVIARLEPLVASTSEPRIFLYNASRVRADRPKVGFAMLDLTRRDPDIPGMALNLRVEGLETDYLLPETGLGPYALRQRSQRANSVEAGDLVFGYVTTQCQNCGEMRAYWLWLHIGGSGWIREMRGSDQHTYNDVLSRLGTSVTPEELVDELIPVEGRITISEAANW